MSIQKARTMTDQPDSAKASRSFAGRAQAWLFWLATSILATVPLTFSTSVYGSYSLPRLAILVVGASILAAVLLLVAAISPTVLAPVRTRLLLLLSLYLLAIAVSSIFGAAPYVSLLGSFENRMGLLTHFCFFVCCVSLVVGIGHSPSRFRYCLWAMAASGLLTAIYAVAQSAGFDPFVPSRLYTYRAGADSIVRAIGAIGHADFLGN